MMMRRVLVVAGMVLAQGELDLMASAPTVVSLFAKDSAPKSPSAQWTTEITMSGKLFTCSFTENVEKAHKEAVVAERKARLSPLEGHCDSLSGITVCINDHIALPDGTSFVLSQSPAHADLGFQAFIDPKTTIVKAVLECETVPIKASKKGKRCRAGDGLPEYRVITQVFSNNTVAVKSTRSVSGPAEVVPMESVGCDSLGLLSEKRLSFVKSVSGDTDGVLQVVVASPLCGRADQPLETVFGGCFAGGFFHRQFEVCLGGTGVVDFRAVQLMHRLNHPWPSSVSLKGPAAAGEWEYDSHSRSLTQHVPTDTQCRSFQPFLSENYLVTVSHPRMTLKAVGGPFTPLLFAAGKDGVEGVLWFDAKHPKACTDAAFKEHPKGPWIAVAERGECMFQEKALVAQKQGAVGLVIVNNVRKGMIPAMAGIAGNPAVDIHAVLVDIDGTVVKQLNGVEAKIHSAPLPGSTPPGADERMHVKVNVRCIDEMDARPCKVGDQVVVELDGEVNRQPGHIVDKINAELFSVKLDPHKPPEETPGWQIFKNAESPCTAQTGTFISEIIRSDTCELTVNIHSALLCADTRFKRALLQKHDIVCELM